MTNATNIADKSRFAVAWFKDSNDILGWNGCLVDNTTGKRHTLRHYEVFEQFQDEVVYQRCAFPTKAALTAAARREARRLAA